MKVNLSNLISNWIKKGSTQQESRMEKKLPHFCQQFSIRTRKGQKMCSGAENELHRII